MPSSLRTRDMNTSSGQLEVEAIYGVLVPGCEDGFYLFADRHEAEDIAWAVSDNGNVAELSKERCCIGSGAPGS